MGSSLLFSFSNLKNIRFLSDKELGERRSLVQEILIKKIIIMIMMIKHDIQSETLVLMISLQSEIVKILVNDNEK